MSVHDMTLSVEILAKLLDARTTFKKLYILRRIDEIFMRHEIGSDSARHMFLKYAPDFFFWRRHEHGLNVRVHYIRRTEHLRPLIKFFLRIISRGQDGFLPHVVITAGHVFFESIRIKQILQTTIAMRRMSLMFSEEPI